MSRNPKEALEKTRETLRKLQRMDRKKLRDHRQQFDSAEAFLKGVFPRLGAIAPRRIGEKAVLSHTSHHLKGAERRLGACAQCPESGGACEEDTLGHRPGLQPVWSKHGNSSRLDLVECPKWAEWLSRTRVIRAGVEKRLAGNAFRDVAHFLEGDKESETAHLIGEFVEACRESSDPNLVLVGKNSTLVAVGLLRSILAKVPDMKARFVRCSQVGRPLKDYYAAPTQHEHPLKPLLKIDLLVFVEMTIFGRASEDWLDDELRDLIYSRYLDNLPTVLATETEEPKRLGHHYFRTKVPVCLTK